MLVDHYSSLLGNVRSLLVTTVEPIAKISAIPFNAYRYLQQDFKSLELLKKLKNDLETENFLLQAKQQRFNQLELEILRLNNLLGKASQLTAVDVQLANILHYNISEYANFVTINKGHLDGVRNKQAVIDDRGLLGIVTITTPTTARVQLIIDTEIQVPVRVQRTGQRGIVKGFSNNQLYLQFIPQGSSVEIGDILVTSGLANVYLPGQPVATLTQIKELKGQPNLKILATPVAKIMYAEKVLVLSSPAYKSSSN